MKIGILTQPLWGNFGGLLQNYALQQVLKSMGHDVVTLDYLWGTKGFNYVILQARIIVAALRGRCKFQLLKYAPGRNNPAIEEFVNNNITTTDRFWNSYHPQLVDKYDLQAVIVGSDQVWRPCYNPSIKDSFLQFTADKNIRRIAYGASFGTSEWEYSPQLARECSLLLKKFDAVSVREESGIKLLEKLGCRTGCVVLDPTLLLSASDYENISNITPTKDYTPHGEYICTYFLDDAHRKEDYADSLGHKLGLYNAVHLSIKDDKLDPAKWLDQIRRASFFVTDSFHGTVMCLIHHIPFLTVINKKRGVGRLHDLLKSVDLEYRLISDELIAPIPQSKIDWGNVDEKILLLREKSLIFLKKSLA